MAASQTSSSNRLALVKGRTIHRIKGRAHAAANTGFTIVSSMPLRMVVSPEPQRLVATCLALSLPLLVVHDGPDASLVPPVRIPKGVHAVNLFEVMPTMRLLTNSGSPIDDFYAARGTAEPFEINLKRHGIASGKLLVRKVAAMAYTVALAMHGGSSVAADTRVVLWVDADVQFLKAPDARFLAFAERHDVSYIPFVSRRELAPTSHQRLRGEKPSVVHELLHEGWRLDSGLMAFPTRANGLGLISAALDLYKGGLLRMWRKCRQLSQLKENGLQECPSWLTRNLYMNDVYVWALLLHAAAHAAHTGSLPKFIASELSAFNATTLSQGWFAYDYSKQKPNFISFAEPNATPFTSPFDLREYIVHHILTGPYSKVSDQGLR